MIKRTLYFGNPVYLKTTNEQMVTEMQDSGKPKNGSEEMKEGELMIFDS